MPDVENPSASHFQTIAGPAIGARSVELVGRCKVQWFDIRGEKCRFLNRGARGS